jgi:hypothetical protein
VRQHVFEQYWSDYNIKIAGATFNCPQIGNGTDVPAGALAKGGTSPLMDVIEARSGVHGQPGPRSVLGDKEFVPWHIGAVM